MSNRIDVRIEGLDGILEEFEEIANAAALKQAIGRACALVERDAKTKAPKGVGDLRRSITSKVEDRHTEIVGVVYTPLEYAPYVEYGTGLFAEEGGRQDVPWCYQDEEDEWHTTSGMHPRPFMRPALNENREQIKRIIKEGINND